MDTLFRDVLPRLRPSVLMDIVSDLSESTSDSDELIELLDMIKEEVILKMGEQYWNEQYEKYIPS